MAQTFTTVNSSDDISESRADFMNNDLALRSCFSGTSAPSPTVAYMLWADTTNNLLKIRNAADSAWITIGDLTAANLGLLPLSGGTMTGNIDLYTNSKFITVADPTAAQHAVTKAYFEANQSKPSLACTMETTTDATYTNAGYHDAGSDRFLRWAAYRNVGSWNLTTGGTIIEVPEDGDYIVEITVVKPNSGSAVQWETQTPATGVGVRKGWCRLDYTGTGTSTYVSYLNQLTAGDDFWVIEDGSQSNAVDTADSGSRYRLVAWKV